jgi:hemoglobin
MSLYEKYGGQATVASLVDLFYAKILADERIKHHFQNTDMPRQKRHQTAFISQVLGGPKDYQGLDMRKAHARLKLQESDFSAVAEHLQNTLQEAGVEPDDLGAIMGAVASLKPDVLNL